jgi:hypothetical protein
VCSCSYPSTCADEGQSATACLPLDGARYFRASAAIRREFLIEKAPSFEFFQISMASYPYPLSQSIPFEQSISGKGRTSYVPIDIGGVKYFTDLLIHAHTSQRSCCRDLLYELSALYTFETLEKFHPSGQILPTSLLGK